MSRYDQACGLCNRSLADHNGGKCPASTWKLPDGTDCRECSKGQPCNTYHAGELGHTPTPDMTKPGIFPWTKKEQAYIVRAVNSHEALLEAMKEAAKFCKSDSSPYQILWDAIKQAEARS